MAKHTYTKENEAAILAALGKHATMSDKAKRVAVAALVKAIGDGVTSRSIIGKAQCMKACGWTPYKPAEAKSVKRGPTRQEQVNTLTAMLGLERGDLQSLARSVSADLAVLVSAVTNTTQAAKLEPEANPAA